MILLTIFGLIISYGILMYVRQRQRNRLADRHERFEEKQEELLELLRKRKEQEQRGTEADERGEF